MKNNNPTLWILALIMVINALSYGVIIPLLYPLATKLSLGAVGLGWLMASFSLAQFIATPFIGRLSDRYGRKPLLLLSVLGSSISMAFLAVATNKYWFFAARVLDGVTGGNNSVAQAVIADTTDVKHRANAFALLGAAFGFGFLVGPALGGVLGHYGLHIPFWFAAGLALLAVVLGFIFMKETLSVKNSKAVSIEELFHWKKLFHSLNQPFIGKLFMLSMMVSLAQSGFIIGVQSVGYDVLHLTTGQLGLMLTGVGLMAIVMQVWLIRWISKHIQAKSLVLVASLVLAALMMLILFRWLNPINYIIFNMLYALFLSTINPITAGLVSSHIKDEDQGLAMGLNQAYISLGTIVGPLVSGLVISAHPTFTFISTAVILGAAALLVSSLPKKSVVVNL